MNKQQFIEFLQEKLPDEAIVDLNTFNVEINSPQYDSYIPNGHDRDGFVIMKPIVFIDNYSISFDFSVRQ